MELLPGSEEGRLLLQNQNKACNIRVSVTLRHHRESVVDVQEQ